MVTREISDDRVSRLNQGEVTEGDYTLYWMQQAQRAECNHALEFAIQRANENRQRLLVGFGLMEDYPDANLRHFQFMLEGLQQVAVTLRQRSIPLVVQFGNPAEVACRLASRASEVICDRGYLRHQVGWRQQVAREVKCRVWQVETDVIVPVEMATDKREYAARTLRPKLNDVAEEYLVELATTAIEKDSLNLGVDGVSLDDCESLLKQLSIDRKVGPSPEFRGGTSQAKALLQGFLKDHLSNYEDRNLVTEPAVSRLSPYLHFGQISPIVIAAEIKSKRGVAKSAKESFLEELLVRRELAHNFVHFEADYDSTRCLPDWAAETLAAHEDDPREHHYTAGELEEATTHDPVWNAAMIEMKERGYLHNHLRMYWGKKVIEWTNTTNHAYRTALELNNRYFLDGRDCNSYTNILWLFGLHDRAHQERAIFGKVRYMSAGGLERKFAVKEYLRAIEDRYGTEIRGKE